MDAELEARFTRLEQEIVPRMEQRIAELERENQALRVAATPAMEEAKEEATLPRRDLLKGAAYALGAVSLSLVGTRPAEATTGFMQYGATNSAGSTYTFLGSNAFSYTLALVNSLENQSDPNNGMALSATSFSGHAIRAQVFRTGAPGNGLDVYVEGNGHGVFVDKPNEFGHSVLAYQKSTTGFYAAIAGVTSNGGPGLHGRGEGSGNGVWGQIADSAKAQSAILGTTEGNGAAIEGNSILGRGGLFKGKKAAVRLVASSASNKPSTGTRGDLFVDSSGRLWYCKTSNSTTGWKQLA